MTLYGLRNCDSTKKAMRWLEQHQLSYDLHDYNTSGIEKSRLQTWEKDLGWDKLLNKRGTTWRKIKTPAIETSLDAASAVALMHQHTSLIKRPLLVTAKGLLLGFNEAEYNKLI